MSLGHIPLPQAPVHYEEFYDLCIILGVMHKLRNHFWVPRDPTPYVTL